MDYIFRKIKIRLLRLIKKFLKYFIYLMIEEKEMYCSNSSFQIIKMHFLSPSPIIKRTKTQMLQNVIVDRETIHKYKERNGMKCKNSLSCGRNSIHKLSSFSNDFSEIIEDIKHRNVHSVKNDEIEIRSLTNTERISDFYEYTEECMKKLQSLIRPKVELKKVSIPHTHKKLLLLDLDETLVHCTGKVTEENNNYQHTVEVTLSYGKKARIGINIRPYFREALEMLKENYTLVIYTASHQSYTDAVLNLIDPNRELFEYRLYRNNCIPIKIEGNNFFIKDLNIIENYSLNDIVIVDNSVLSFAFHIDNGIPIVPYYEGTEDSELKILSLYLTSICKETDLRKANKLYIKLDTFLQNDNDIKTDSDSEESNNGNESTIGERLCIKDIYNDFRKDFVFNNA